MPISPVLESTMLEAQQDNQMENGIRPGGREVKEVVKTFEVHRDRPSIPKLRSVCT